MKLHLLGSFSSVNYKTFTKQKLLPGKSIFGKSISAHFKRVRSSIYIWILLHLYIYIYLHIKGRFYYQYVKHNVKTINMKDISQVWLCMELYQLKSRHNLRYKSAGNDASQWRKCQLTRDGDTEASLSMGVRFMSIEIIQTCGGPSMEDPQ